MQKPQVLTSLSFPVLKAGARMVLIFFHCWSLALRTVDLIGASSIPSWNMLCMCIE